MALKESTKEIIRYIQQHNGTNMTAADVAEALGVSTRSVDGVFTRSLQAKGYGVRTPAEVELESGLHKTVKLLSLTPAGMAFDVDAEPEAKSAE
jgi:transcriptional regulator GlxA family with amidase domain